MVDMRYGHRGNLYFKFQVEFPPNNFMDNEKLKVRPEQVFCGQYHGPRMDQIDHVE